MGVTMLTMSSPMAGSMADSVLGSMADSVLGSMADSVLVLIQEQWNQKFDFELKYWITVTLTFVQT